MNLGPEFGLQIPCRGLFTLPTALPLAQSHVRRCPSGPSGPELQHREQAPVTAGQTCRAGVGRMKPWGFWPWRPGGTLRKHGHVALSILTMTSWVSQRAHEHVNLDFLRTDPSLLIVPILGKSVNLSVSMQLSRGQ